MKNTIRRLIVGLLTAVLVLSTVACGKSSDNAKPAAEPAKTEAPAAEEKKEEVKEEAPAEEVKEEAAEEVAAVDPLQDFWAGDWFGYMWIEDAEGQLAEWSNCYWDAMATIDLDEAGNADMLMWYESLSREKPSGHVQLTISADSGSGPMGAAISESGWVFVDSNTGNGDVHHADWIIDPMTDPTSKKFGNDMIHFYGEYEEGGGTLYYHYFLRKWGASWDDVEQDEEELIPRGYHIWYKPLVDEGFAMPNNIGEPGSVKMDGTVVSGTPAAAVAEAPAKEESGNEAPATEEFTGGYDGGELILVDDDYCTIKVIGTGAYELNDSWIGYLMVLVNKTDRSLYFTPYADPDVNAQTVSSLGKGNTCYFGGERTKTHMGVTVKGGKTVDNACLAVDGVTDVSQLKDVKGYISVSDNDTGEVLNNVPYHF